MVTRTNPAFCPLIYVDQYVTSAIVFDRTTATDQHPLMGWQDLHCMNHDHLILPILIYKSTNSDELNLVP